MENKGDFSIENLNQLVKSLEEAVLNLEESYKKNDFASFSKSKKIILQIQEKISEVGE